MTTFGYLLVRFFYLLVGLLFTCGIVIKMLNCIKQHLNGLGIFWHSFFRENLGKIISPLISVRSKKN
jgi:hypothetical protein